MGTNILARGGIGVALAAVGAFPATAQTCQRARVPFCVDCVTQGTIFVEKDKPCLMSSDAGTSNVEIRSRRIVESPRNGQAGQTGPSFRAYQPKPGFVGEDSFVEEVRLKLRGQEGVMRITWKVVVR